MVTMDDISNAIILLVRVGAVARFVYCLVRLTAAEEQAAQYKDDDTLEFFTAWSSVPTILEALSRKYPDQTISYCWADEDIGSNVGEAVYKNGEMIDANIPEPGSREAYELASDIMGIDLADFDLYLSADKSTYEYHEDPPKTKRTKDGPAR